MTDWAEAKARECCALLYDGNVVYGAREEAVVARALREARAKGIEEAIEAVADAGGDNCDYHIEAICKLNEPKNP